MSLADAKPQLEQNIMMAFKNAQENAKKQGMDPLELQKQIQLNLAKDLSNAINIFVSSADVDISGVTSTVSAGVPVSLNQNGQTVSNMTGQTSAEGKVQHKFETSKAGKLK